MVRIPLEDNFVDVLMKAQRGLGLGNADLTRLSGVPEQDIEQLKAGQLSETALRKLGPVLGLGADAWLGLARNEWRPEPRILEGLAQFNTRFGDMTVNAYLAWDDRSREAVAFDTGANAFSLMATVRTRNLRLKYLLLTHTHGDHVADLDRFRSDSKAEIWVSEREPYPEAKTFADGRSFEVGALRIQTRSTSGHSAGGTTYVIAGLGTPVAVVGDALFAASMGGGKISYRNALESNRSQILTLPDDCILCPGHGPLTTVGEEKQHNPFFPEFQTVKQPSHK